MSYRVTWEIDIEADSARDAAKKAQDIQRRPDSTATVFKVERPDGSVAMCDLWDGQRQSRAFGSAVRHNHSPDDLRRARLNVPAQAQASTSPGRKLTV